MLYLVAECSRGSDRVVCGGQRWLVRQSVMRQSPNLGPVSAATTTTLAPPPPPPLAQAKDPRRPLRHVTLYPFASFIPLLCCLHHYHITTTPTATSGLLTTFTHVQRPRPVPLADTFACLPLPPNSSLDAELVVSPQSYRCHSKSTNASRLLNPSSLELHSFSEPPESLSRICRAREESQSGGLVSGHNRHRPSKNNV